MIQWNVTRFLNVKWPLLGGSGYFFATGPCFFLGGKGLYLAMLELTCRRQTKKLGRIIDLLIWSPVAPVEGGWCEISNCLYLVIQSDLFGMVKWPFKGLSDLQLGDKKVTLNHLVDIYSIWCIGMSPPLSACQSPRGLWNTCPDLARCRTSGRINLHLPLLLTGGSNVVWNSQSSDHQLVNAGLRWWISTPGSELPANHTSGRVSWLI